jgi:hypothetical protein
MVDAMKRFRLSPASTAALDMPDLGIWNGAEFVLVTRQEDGWWDKARLLWRYGTAPLWTNRLMKSTTGKFLSMYDEPVFPWRSLSEVVEEVGLLEVTGVTGEQYLKANGVGEAFSREIIQARYVIRVLVVLRKKLTFVARESTTPPILATSMVWRRWYAWLRTALCKSKAATGESSQACSTPPPQSSISILP